MKLCNVMPLISFLLKRIQAERKQLWSTHTTHQLIHGVCLILFCCCWGWNAALNRHAIIKQVNNVFKRGSKGGNFREETDVIFNFFLIKVIQFVTVELNRRREEYQKRMQEEASQAFSQAETNAVKKLKRMLAKEKQRVKSLKRSIAVEKTNRERRIKERNKNLCKRNRQLRARVNNLSPKDLRDFSSVGTSRCCEARNDEQSWSTRNRQLWARVKKLKMKDGINSTSAGTVMCCEASDDQQSWSSDSDEEETVGHQPERRPSGI